MPMPPALRRAMLAAHIVCSVGWLGAAAAYLALGVAAEVTCSRRSYARPGSAWSSAAGS